MKHIPPLLALTICLLASPAFADITQLRHDADAGNATAQIELAQAYHDGAMNLKKSDEDAVKWFRKAAEQGNLEGQFNLGIAYYHGFGVKKDLTEAVTWFRKAAEQGYGDAQYILAAAYQNGIGGMPKDIVQADLWLGLAEAQGNKDAARERISLESTMTDADITQAKLLLAAHTPAPMSTPISTPAGTK